MFFLRFVTNVKDDKHTIRIMFKYDYKYAILLDKLRFGKISFCIGIHCIQGSGVNHPFRWTFSRLIYHIYKTLYCFTVECYCIHVKYKFKRKYAE